MAGQQICLKWNSFQSNIVTSFESLWEEEGLVDVTLASDGQCIKAHKVILSACSPFLRQVFQNNPCQHPVIILQDVHFSELESLLCFVYKGEVNIEQENLPALLQAAETLQIRGLSGASEQVKEKMGASRKPSTVPSEENSLDDHPPPIKRQKNNVQPFQTSPMLAATPTTPSPVGTPRASAEPWEQPREPEGPSKTGPSEMMPKMEPLDSSPLRDESTDASGDLMLPLDKLADPDLIKGFPSSEASPFHADPIYDPTQGTKSFPFPPFPCPFCDRSYTSWGFRRRHIKAIHTQSPRLSCKWCLQVLPCHGDWQNHVMAEHNLSSADAHNGLLILEEAHMVLQIPNPTRLETFVSMIKKSGHSALKAADPESADSSS